MAFGEKLVGMYPVTSSHRTSETGTCVDRAKLQGFKNMIPTLRSATTHE